MRFPAAGPAQDAAPEGASAGDQLCHSLRRQTSPVVSGCREMETSVCIATFKRPAGLRRLLSSIEGQRGELPSFEVVVVDNDPNGSAADVCREFTGRLTIRYVVEPVPGVSSARNRAVASGIGRYLAFIDDDEEASPSWLEMLHAQAVRLDADVVIGAVLLRFETPPAAWIRNCGRFDKALPADGEKVPLHMTRIGNCYIRRAVLPTQQAPFDLELGFLGGEDTELFNQLIKRGAKIVAAPRAIVSEDYPASRTTARWAILRSFRIGGATAYILWRDLSRGQKLYRALGSAFQAARYTVVALLRLPKSRAEAFSTALTAVIWLGRAAWFAGITYAAYGRSR
jgi:succinoglycan biosynthesis protein ExoM